jgi:hypothetical protein
MSIDKYVDKKFINANDTVPGYVTGMQLANMYGFTAQNPSCIETCPDAAVSSAAGTGGVIEKEKTGCLYKSKEFRFQRQGILMTFSRKIA